MNKNAQYLFDALTYADSALILEADRALYRAPHRAKSTKKLWRIALIAALLAALFSVTAAANGWFGLETRYIPPAEAPDTSTAEYRDFAVFTGGDWAYICPSGASGSPENRAQRAWIEYRAAFLAEKETDAAWKAEYFNNYSSEWLASYDGGAWRDTAMIYGAFSPEMLDRLRAIARENAVALHTSRATAQSIESLAELTGCDGLLPPEDTLSHAYVYEDGSFYASVYSPALDGTAADGYYFIYAARALSLPEYSFQVKPAEYELRRDWLCTLPSGEEVYLSRLPTVLPEGMRVPADYVGYDTLFVLCPRGDMYITVQTTLRADADDNAAEAVAARFAFTSVGSE